MNMLSVQLTSATGPVPLFVTVQEIGVGTFDSMKAGVVSDDATNWGGRSDTRKDSDAPTLSVSTASEI